MEYVGAGRMAGPGCLYAGLTEINSAVRNFSYICRLDINVLTYF